MWNYFSHIWLLMRLKSFLGFFLKPFAYKLYVYAFYPFSAGILAFFKRIDLYVSFTIFFF